MILKRFFSLVCHRFLQTRNWIWDCSNLAPHRSLSNRLPWKMIWWQWRRWHRNWKLQSSRCSWLWLVACELWIPDRTRGDLCKVMHFVTNAWSLQWPWLWSLTSWRFPRQKWCFRRFLVVYRLEVTGGRPKSLWKRICSRCPIKYIHFVDVN